MRAFAATCALLLAGACIDPVHTDAVEALGPETGGLRPGPLHRAGQPCLTCHGGEGPGPDFVAAGTVYTTRGSATAIEGVTVVLKDATGSEQRRVTNRVGNFYLEERAWSPTFPLFVRLESAGTTQVMETRIGRDGGCASCHRGNGDAAHMPAVYMKE